MNLDRHMRRIRIWCLVGSCGRKVILAFLPGNLLNRHDELGTFSAHIECGGINVEKEARNNVKYVEAYVQKHAEIDSIPHITALFQPSIILNIGFHQPGPAQ